MQDSARIGAAALGGYVLGRTKKGKAAIGLALWLSGHGLPRDILRRQAVKALQSDDAQEILSQLRGPLLSAARRAAGSLLEGQAGSLSDSLKHRAGRLRNVPGEVAEKTADLVERTGIRKDKGDASDEADQADADEQETEAQDASEEPEADEQEAQPQGSSDEDESYEDESDEEESEEQAQEQSGRQRRRAVWSDGESRKTAGKSARRSSGDRQSAVNHDDFEGVEAKREKAPIRRSRPPSSD